MSETTFDEQFTELQRAINAAWEATLGVLGPALQAAIEAICERYEQIQRAFFGAQLSGYLPDNLAWWLADHWPARWLPHPKFDEE